MTFPQDYDNTEKLYLNMGFGLQNAQNSFKMASWDDPAEQTVLERVSDKPFIFPLHSNWTKKGHNYLSKEFTINPNFSFQDPLKILLPP